MGSCAACGHGNRENARFCSDCGGSMVAVCGGCGGPKYPGERFCSQCGAPAASVPTVAPASATAPEGERKQVTVLFADVARSMELAERLNADELSQVMSGLFDVCREAVEAYGGTVDKFTGDGVMALFGAPLALEDHARRACHAALRLLAGVTDYAVTLRQKGVELAVRVGLNSGEVVAGSVGGDAVGGAYTAVGHTVGLAQRMESLAELGTVCLSWNTAALVGAEFRLRDLGEVAVKGSSVPVRVFALDGAAGGSAAAGRDSELATLAAALTGAQDGRAQVVGLVGQAGAGKSRLCEELARHATQLGVTVRRTAGVSHAQAVPLLPILGLFRDYFSVAADATPAEVRASVRTRLLDLDPGLADELGLVFDFLEVPDPELPAPKLGPEARRRRVLEVLRRITVRRSERTTLLLILEDLHWFDAHSVAFLEGLLPSYSGTKTLVVLNFRPEFHAPWTNHSYYRQLPLAPLDGPAVGELLSELLGPGLPAVARQLLVRAGGNPFFAEELVRGLASDGTLTGEPGAYQLVRPTSEVLVPPTVQAVLAARIDRIPGREKSVLHAAAVIGRTVTDAILGAVTGEAPESVEAVLHVLCVEELLQATGAAGEYRFWHPLTQEVAYGTLLTATRRRLHRRVAQALVGLGTERHDELAALIATHFEAAGDDLETARWQLRAGVRVMLSDYAEAGRRLRSTIDHLAALGEETAETVALDVRAHVVLLRLGARAGMDLVEADRLVAEARASAERLGDPALLARLGFADGTFQFYGGDHLGAADSARTAIRNAELSTQPLVRAVSLGLAGYTAAYTGPLSESIQAVEAATALCDGDPLVGIAEIGISLIDLAGLAHALACIPRGGLVAAHGRAQAAVDGFVQRPAPEWRAWALTLFADLAALTGDPAQAAPAAEAATEALALARDSGSIAATVKAGHAVGIVAVLQGRPAEAVTALSEALSEARRHRSGQVHEPGLLITLARAHLACGEGTAARTAAEEAVAVARRQGARVIECLAHFVRAQALHRTAAGRADLDEARAAIAAGEALAAETGALTYAAFLAEERARLDADPEALRAAADGYHAIGATGHARLLHVELDSG